jgi:hypothetical protein
MAGDIKLKYPAASTAMTVTALHSLASSQDWSAGWSSATVVNTTNVYLDYLYGFTFTTASSGTRNTTANINIYVIASLNDTPTWPATASGTIGTEGALSFTDTEERDTLCRLLGSITVDNTASAIYTFPQTGIAQLFGGVMPTHHAIYVSHNLMTTAVAGLHTSGSAVYYTPVTAQYT